MNGVYGLTYALVSDFVTRWTTTWLSCCSMLLSQHALKNLILICAKEVSQLSRQRIYAPLERARDILQSTEFWIRLVRFLRVVIPTI